MRSNAALIKAGAEIVALTSGAAIAAAARGDQALASSRDRLMAELANEKEALEKWKAAVTQRDEAIKKAIGEINTLEKARNDAIAKFNDLAGKYNTLVKDDRTRRGDIEGNPAQPPRTHPNGEPSQPAPGPSLDVQGVVHEQLRICRVRGELENFPVSRASRPCFYSKDTGETPVIRINSQAHCGP